MAMNRNPSRLKSAKQAWWEEHERSLNEGSGLGAAQRNADFAAKLWRERNIIEKAFQ
jgi:hypothetical protein